MLRIRWRGCALLVGCLGLSLAAGGAVAADAHQGRSVALQESAAMKVTVNDGKVHEAEGSVTGTVSGRVHLRMTVEDASRITAEFSTKGSGGGLTGTVAASYTVSGSILRFTGTSTITGGTGPYASAHGRGVQIEGVMNRLKATMSVKLAGTIRT
jgi:hypothetical protein